MCLIKSSLIPRITLKEKVVYKILIIDHPFYITPFMLEPIVIGSEYVGEFRRTFLIFTFFKKCIKEGYIHCFKTITDARMSKTTESVIVKCVIPKYTLYWKGNLGDIASRKLIYKEIIE